MEARLSEVQKRLLLVLWVSLVLALVVRPEPGNRSFADALTEIEAFRVGFARGATETQLRRQAAGQSDLGLPELVAAVNTKRGPKLKLSPQAVAPHAVAAVSLANLNEIHKLSGPHAALTVGAPDAAALGASLAWRLARSTHNGTFSLESVALVAAQVTAEEADLDQKVGDLRLQSLAARAALDEATRRVSSAEHRVEKRNKRHSRSLDKAQEQLDKARAAFDDKTRTHAEAQERYDSAAVAAERTRPAAAFARVPEAAIARVQLTQSGATIRYDIPVRLALRAVPVTTLRGAEFSALHASGLWEEVSGLDPNAASDAIRAHFNWHFRTARVLGMSLSGAKVLQLAPCFLPFVLAFLLLQMRRAETFYSPFTTKVPSAVPHVGFKYRTLEFAVLVILPVLAPVGASVALGLIHELPILPALSGVICLGLGCYAFRKLQDLREQAISIVRSHSYPPPAADLSPINWG